MRMYLTEHLDDARLVETLTAALALGKAAEVERFGARQGKHVVVDGIVVGEIDGRSDSDRDDAGDEVLIALTNLGACRRGGGSRGVFQVHDDMTQLGLRSQRHRWNGARVC